VTRAGPEEGVIGGSLARDPLATLRQWLDLPADRSQVRLRAIRDGLLISGLLATAFVLVVIPLVGRSLGYDAYAYWSIDAAAMYTRTLEGQYVLGGFRYAPPIGLLGSLLHVLPWWLFVWLWIAAMLAALIYLGGGWSLFLLALPPVALELEQGNVHLLLAAAIVMGFRWPWTWAFVLLTKVTPGVGLLWFAVRREWRALAIAAGFTLLVVGASAVLAPNLWSEWLNALSVNAGQSQEYSLGPPVVIRLPLAALLVAWGARTDRPWTVGVAAMLALPLVWPHGLTVALAAVPFLHRRSILRRAADPAGSRRRFIAIRELLGPDQDGARLGAPQPLRAVGLLAACVGIFLAAAVVAEPLVRPTIEAVSRSIVPSGV
jgi:Glycosyltransferase family 87